MEDTKQYNYEGKPVLLKSLELLKHVMFELNYAHNMLGCREDIYNPNKKVWFFEPLPEIQTALDEFITRKKNQKYKG